MDLNAYLIPLTPAEEGLGIDTVKNIKQSVEYFNTLSSLKAAKDAEKRINKKNPSRELVELTKSNYQEAAKNALLLKALIDEQDEPSGFFARICTELTPIFDFKFPESETHMSGGEILGTALSFATGNNTVYYHNTSYNDNKSITTNNAVKSSYHKRMNLLLRNIAQKLNYLNGLLKRAV